MSIKKLFYLLSIIIATFFCACKTVSFQKYFPVEKDKFFIYETENDSIHVKHFDTLICREAISRLHSKTNMKGLLLENNSSEVNSTKELVKLYYFECLQLDSEANYFMQDKSFGKHLYCIYKKHLFVEFGWSKKMEYSNFFYLLFPKRLKKGIFYQHINGDYWKSFRYVGKETVLIENKLYEDCLKMEIFETFGQSKKIGTVWLAKNIGVVRWLKQNEKVPFIRFSAK